MNDAPWPSSGLGSLSVDEIARRAEALLNDPVLAAVLNEMDSEAVTTWKTSVSPGQREECWHKIAVIAEMRRKLNAAIEDFKLRADRDRRKAIKLD